ncbi:MAG: S9 family peptidase [Bacteroidales bacterium]|nr:S9 family peptidase [Bacteroidales bacterium]
MRVVSIFFVLFLMSALVQAQDCKPLNYNVYDNWNDLVSIQLSNNGAFVTWEWNPQRGDGNLILFTEKSQKYDTLERGAGASFLPQDRGLVYKMKPPFDSLRKQELAGIKAEKQKKDSLRIKLFNTDTSLAFGEVKSYQTAKKEGHLLVVQYEESFKLPKDTTIKNDTAQVKKPEKKKSSKKDPKTTYVEVVDLITQQMKRFEKVSAFTLSDFNNMLFLVQQKGDSIDSTYVSRYDLTTNDLQSVFAQPGQAIHPNLDEKGKQLTFLYSADTSSRKVYQLAYWNTKMKEAMVVIDTISELLPDQQAVSEHFKPYFSDDGTTLYLGLAAKPDPRFKDSLTADEKVSLDIWNWKDGRLQTQQLKELSKDQKQTFLAAYYPESQQLIPLADSLMDEVRADNKLNRKLLIGVDRLPYELISTWEQTRYADIYAVDRFSGKRKLLLSKHESQYSLAPSSDFLLFYQTSDSSWYSLNVKNLQKTRLTDNTNDVFYDVENDIPNEAGALGFAGWINEKYAVVYSRNHLWKLDVTAKEKPMQLTPLSNGKETVYRILSLDREDFYLPQLTYLSTFDRKSKASGFASLDLKTLELKRLKEEESRLTGLMKAKEADVFIFREETFKQYPDLHLTSNDFETSKQISDANPQQKDYCWGDVRMVDWNSFNGDSLQGLLYFPAHFDVKKNYPLIVYFYETHSNDLYRHITPRPSRSTINISDYTSRGYFVFTPDIKYRNALPGQSAYDAILSGTLSMVERFPQIDVNRMGLQGQSWGGYQTAWLVTRTNLFKAAMAGAPVSNMTSAYGGIRWESGMSRAFQYEEGQSRIGATLWENQQAYIENSPLFYADRVSTPLLIMANDNDGAVPWYQGIEYFSALRRLGKPSWMLVYNNAPHNLSRRADAMDLTVRMQQFFDHYLQGDTMPFWMKEGVPALKKGKVRGF